MKSEEAMNREINAITVEIRNKFPELSKYLNEMAVTIPDDNHPHITLQKLKAYHDSLVDLLKHYAETHKGKK
jgi:hypothetical protein